MKDALNPDRWARLKTDGTSRAVGAHAGACPLPDLQITVRRPITHLAASCDSIAFLRPVGLAYRG